MKSKNYSGSAVNIWIVWNFLQNTKLTGSDMGTFVKLATVTGYNVACKLAKGVHGMPGGVTPSELTYTNDPGAENFLLGKVQEFALAQDPAIGDAFVEGGLGFELIDGIRKGISAPSQDGPDLVESGTSSSAGKPDEYRAFIKDNQIQIRDGGTRIKLADASTSQMVTAISLWEAKQPVSA